MPPVYVVQQGAKVRIDNRRLRVEREGEELLHVPLAQVNEVVLFGNIGLTTPAIDTFLAQGTDVVFLSRDGDYRGRLVGGVTPHVAVRRAQYLRAGQPDFVLAMAQGLVAAKLAHMRTLLMRHNRERDDPEIGRSVERLAEALAEIPRKTALASLRGVEGAGSAAYFAGLRRLLDAAWRFERRARQPPPDPVNVLLSFGYTLLSTTATGAVQTVGLDPYLGFLHEVAYNRPALGLDLLEEFRPVVDGVVLWCCNSGQLSLADFTPGPAERPVVLSEAGQRRFLAAYEQRLMQTFTHPARGLELPLRQCLIEQARQIAERLIAGTPGYRGMGFR